MLSGLQALSHYLVRGWHFTGEEAEVQRGEVAGQGHRGRRWDPNPCLLDRKASAFDPLHILPPSRPESGPLLQPAARVSCTHGWTFWNVSMHGDAATLLAGRIRAS